ncbi:hypothetical protein [Desulfurispira natronophila]|uniref:Uncharacterized protein n=1 Tax=Desulfurispira natronophila TaxID=682562 RepID=A0A7W7Y5B7_9BACT|nr:hypothetical protein [Desulfurispira natronophila]MBB5022376.1 hypothetical protein [Desulfurispira natronophila]
MTKLIHYIALLLVPMGAYANPAEREENLDSSAFDIEYSNPIPQLGVNLHFDEIDTDEISDMDDFREAISSLSLTLGSLAPPKDMEFTLSGGEFSFLIDDLVYYAERESPLDMEQRVVTPQREQLRTLRHSDTVDFRQEPFAFLKNQM